MNNRNEDSCDVDHMMKTREEEILKCGRHSHEAKLMIWTMRSADYHGLHG